MTAAPPPDHTRYLRKDPSPKDRLIFSSARLVEDLWSPSPSVTVRLSSASRLSPDARSALNCACSSPLDIGDSFRRCILSALTALSSRRTRSTGGGKSARSAEQFQSFPYLYAWEAHGRRCEPLQKGTSSVLYPVIVPHFCRALLFKSVAAHDLTY